MTSLPTAAQTEDEYEGKNKCNGCSHKQCDHRFGKDFCLKRECDCLEYHSNKKIGINDFTDSSKSR